MDIRLYETTDTLKATCLLIDKLYHGHQRILVICKNDVMLQELDNLLWQFKQMEFLPHMTCYDSIDPATQPIFLAKDTSQNWNNADVLVACDVIPEQIPCKILCGIISEQTLAQTFIHKYPPTQHFSQTESGGWQKI